MDLPARGRIPAPARAGTRPPGHRVDGRSVAEGVRPLREASITFAADAVAISVEPVRIVGADARIVEDRHLMADLGAIEITDFRRRRDALIRIRGIATRLGRLRRGETRR